MNKLLASFVLFVIPALAQAQTPPDKGPTIGDYKKTLDRIRNGVKVVDKVDTYKNITLQNKKTGVEKKVHEFPEFEQRIFVFFMELRRESELQSLNEKWTAALKKLETAGGDKGKDDDSDDAQAKLSHVKKFLEDLKEQRKLLAATTERTLEKLCDDFPARFTEKEKLFTMKQLKEGHDKEGIGGR